MTFVLTILFFRKDGKWDAVRGKIAFRYFTVLSNVLCALGALALCLFPESRWAWLLKYTGTAAVAVTLLTVLLFLGPTFGYRALLKGADFFLHLITPLLAVFSFSFLEKRGLGFPEALLGLLPVLLYGGVYTYKILLAPQEKAWEDFYGFNRGGKWPLSMAGMGSGALLICLGLMSLQNLP